MNQNTEQLRTDPIGRLLFKLSFPAMIGMLVLMGVVVNNGIVLIDRVHQLRELGLPRERALVEASRDRLRPILMTACSTILAMVPLALGSTSIGGDGPPYYPMARAVIGGEPAAMEPAA